MHRTASAPRTPNPEIPEDDLVLQETLQVSLAERHEDFEAKQNVEKVKDHLMAEEIEKLVKGSKNVEENVEVASSPLRNDDNQTNPNTRLEPRSDKESPEVEKIADISQPVNVNEEEEESAEDDYELRRREKGKHVKEIRNTPSPTIIKSPRISTNLFMPRRKFNALARHLQDIMMESLPKMVDECIKKILQTQVPLHVAKGTILEREKSQAEVAKMIVDAIQQERKNFRSEISSQVNDAITNQIPLQVDSSVMNNPQLQQEDLTIWIALKYKFKRLHMATTPCRPFAICPRDQDDSHDDAHLGGERIVQKGRRHLSMEPTDDDVLPNEKVSQELVDEMSQTVDEAKLHKFVDEMLRHQCTSGDEHQYHIDQMQNFLKSDI
ncbi:hypothetical protein Tco_0912951, partial [Tanacetum coccineum]